MDRNAGSHVRVNRTFSNGFLLLVGGHKGSVISYLLLMAVLRTLPREIRSGSPEYLLYADDLA